MLYIIITVINYMDTIKEKNKNIIKDIDSYLKSINEDRIELIFEYKTNQGDIEHQIGQYFKNMNGDWIGVISGLFYFDFYTLREIISFQPLSNLLNKNK